MPMMTASLVVVVVVVLLTATVSEAWLFSMLQSGRSPADLAVRALKPLFDVDTPDADLPALIRELAAQLLAEPELRKAAERRITLPQAILVTDRIVQGQYAADEQVELLRLLLELLSTRAFLPVVAGEMVAYDDGNGLRTRFPLQLLDGLPFVNLAGEIDESDVLSIPDKILERIWELFDDAPDRVRVPAEYAAAGVQEVRGLFPAPFHLVFPFNAWAASQLAPDLVSLKPGQERRGTIRALAQFGIRFDLDAILNLGLLPSNADLLAVLPYVRYNPDHGGSLPWAAVVDDPITRRGDERGKAAPPAAVWAEGRAAHLERYLPTLYRTPAFVALLRRCPRQFTAAAALLRDDWAYWTLAQQGFVRYPEFAELANLVVVEMLMDQTRMRLPITAGRVTMLAPLVGLPQCDLFRPVPALGSASLLAWLCERRAMFRGLLCSRPVLGRVVEDLPGFLRYLRKLDASEQTAIEQFLDENNRIPLVAAIQDYIGATPQRRGWLIRLSRRCGGPQRRSTSTLDDVHCFSASPSSLFV